MKLIFVIWFFFVDPISSGNSGPVSRKLSPLGILVFCPFFFFRKLFSTVLFPPENYSLLIAFQCSRKLWLPFEFPLALSSFSPAKSCSKFPPVYYKVFVFVFVFSLTITITLWFCLQTDVYCYFYIVISNFNPPSPFEHILL